MARELGNEIPILSDRNYSQRKGHVLAYGRAAKINQKTRDLNSSGVVLTSASFFKIK